MAPTGSEVVWTDEARRRVERAPAFVRPGIWKLVALRARERGRAVVTSEFLTEIRNESMLRVAKCIRGFGFEELGLEAFDVAKRKMRKLPRKVEVIGEIEAFLAARTSKNGMILEKFRRYLVTMPERGLPWTEEALAALERAPAPVRALARGAIEARARARGEKVVTPEVVAAIVAAGAETGEALPGAALAWAPEAAARARRIPIPAIRRIVVARVEAQARAEGLTAVDLPLYERAAGPAPGRPAGS
jgi:hypothetical protein